jgi:predicted transcriptional regulator
MNIYKDLIIWQIMLLSTIKIKRKKLGMSQKELSKQAGISQSLLAKLESGKVEASYSKVQRIFDILDKTEKKSEKKAEDVMTKSTFSAKPNDSVKDAAAKMKAHSISQMPVISGKTQIGSISESGIIDKMQEGKNLDKISVKEIMESPLPIVSKEISISSLLPLLKEAGAVLVVDKEKIAGIVSKSDVI